MSLLENTRHNQSPPNHQPGRVLHSALWIVQVLLAAFFVFAAVPKLLGDPTAVAMFDQIGLGQWFRYAVGLAEVAGAVGLLVPRLSGLAALWLGVVMVGATVTNLFVIDLAGAAYTTLGLLVVFLFVAWGRRGQVAGLARSLAH